MKNFQEKVTLKIDKHRLGVFVPAFRAAAAKGLFRGTNVNEARPAFLRPQSLDRNNEITRNAGVITGAQFVLRHRPGPTLNNHFATTQTRHLRRHSKLKGVEAERSYPRARKRSEVFTRSYFAKANITARFIDINFGFRRRGGAPSWIRALRSDKIRELRHGIEKPHRRVRSKIRREKTEMETRATAGRAR